MFLTVTVARMGVSWFPLASALKLECLSLFLEQFHFDTPVLYYSESRNLAIISFEKLDYTCRARWPEGLLCSTISLKSCNLAQILQSPKSEIVTCVMFSTHTNTSLIKPHLTELDEIHRNRPKSNYNLAKNLQSWSVTSDTQTDPRTDRQRFTHFLSGTPV